MDPNKIFCHNPDCPARGKLGRGNIGIHSRTQRRYICHVCGKTFTESQGTVFYRLRYPAVFVTQMITLLAYGCPIAAIVAAFGLDERTVASWQRRAGVHCQKVHEHLVQQPGDLGQVQADEIRVKHQGGIAWLAMALCVPTRLWLGGMVSVCRDGNLITRLIEQVRRCALCRPLLFCTDGFKAYVSAIQNVFRTPVFTGRRGRPYLRMWDEAYAICIVQVVKEYSAKRVAGVIRRVIQGTQKQVQLLLEKTQNTVQAHVAYIERLNGTFRSRIVALIRRGRSLVRQSETLQQAMYLVGTVYNFCAPHKSLRLVLYLADGSRRWVPRTPAIAAGITDHIWTVQELLAYQVPLPPWEPPKQRGRPSKWIKELINQWVT